MKVMTTTAASAFSLWRQRMTIVVVMVTVQLLWLAPGCQGNYQQTPEKPVNHLLLFDKLPDGIPPNKPVPFDVRTNFSGTVHLVDSRDFRAVVNVTAPTLQQAYEVQADLFSYRGRLMLEISQQTLSGGIGGMTLTWLLIGAAVATAIVGICTISCVVRWYEHERQPMEPIDRRSFASSSQRGGVYRGNCIPMVPLGSAAAGSGTPREFGGGVGTFGGRGLGGGEDGERRCEEELRQVQELPEEEEAEEREMEKRHKLKMLEKEEMALGSGDTNTSDITLDSDDPHERNLIKSRFHSQSKTVHKDLLSTNKRSSPSPSSSSSSAVNNINVSGSGVGSLGRRLLAVRRTQDGTYEGVPRTDPDEDGEVRKYTDSSSTAGQRESLGSQSGTGSVDNRMSPPPNYASAVAADNPNNSSNPATLSDLRVKLEPRKSGKLLSFQDPPSKSKVFQEPKYANDPSENDPLLILADVHKTNIDTPDDKGNKPSGLGQPNHGGISESKRPGNVYVNPTQMKRATPPKLTSFSPAYTTTSTPKLRPTPTSTTSSVSDENPWELNAMSDIAEDPREDERSVVSGDGARSGRSNSMYGSSEIFESGEYRAGLEDFYESILDSDVEVPPLDAEDGALVSDGGLPSPLGFPSLKTGDKGKVNDDIKLIPGALKSPGAHVGRQVGASTRPRPYSSFIYRPTLPLSPVTPNPSSAKPQTVKDPRRDGSAGDDDEEESPPLPPPPPSLLVGGAIASIDDESQSASSVAEGSVFQFPPPPGLVEMEKSSAPDDFGPDYERLRDPRGARGSRDEGRSAQGRGRGGGRGGGGRKLVGGGTYMNVTVICAVCMLSIAGGVYGAFRHQGDQTRVDITLFAPRHFLTNLTRIYLNYHLDTEVKDDNTAESHVMVFDVERPLSDPEATADACRNKSCEHACDEGTGLCACLKGYKALDERRCGDVNECMEGKVRCDPAAGCHNRKGKYNCICGEDFYGDGKTCRDCNLPCPEGHYEILPCSLNVQRVCEVCTQSCRPGHFMAQPCKAKENAICRVCRPECGAGEFESRQCSTHHDRECLNQTLLHQPLTSENLILEDRGHVVEARARLEELPAHYVGFNSYKMYRGTGLYLDVTVRFIDATQQFVPVNDSQVSSHGLHADMPAGLKSETAQKYCYHPLPDYYTLRYKQHKSITYRQNDNGSIEQCDINSMPSPFLGGSSFFGGSGVNVDGSHPSSFFCAQPGALADIFNVEESNFLARTKWVDKSSRCQRSSSSCETCIRNCSTDLNNGNPTCGIRGDDGDNGLSPRLRECFNCCLKRTCSSVCKDYHNNNCQPQQCTEGNLLEFSLKPAWVSSKDERIFCHIKPRPRQYLLNLDYSVRVQGRSQQMINSEAGRSGRGMGRGRGSSRGRSLEMDPDSDFVLYQDKILIYGNEEWKDSGVLTFTDGILDIFINSSLGLTPDFLEVDLDPRGTRFKLGHYKSKGTKFESSNTSNSYMYLRPINPHGVATMPSSHIECSVPELDDMLVASEMENPYIPRFDLSAQAGNSTFPYTVKSGGRDPVVMATMRRESAILQKLFPPTRLREESFQGDVSHNGSHWIVAVTAEVTSCPGYIRMSLYDLAAPSKPVFDCDTAVYCPEMFNLTFALPTSDLGGMFKDALVVITDSRHKHNFRLFRRSSLDEQAKEVVLAQQLASSERSQAAETFVAQLSQGPFLGASDIANPNTDSSSRSRKTPKLPLPLTVLLIIIGAILLLLVLAIIGQCFMSDFPIPDTPYAQVHHAVFAVFYMIFQFVYSIVVSGTCFFLVLTIITNRDVNFIVRYGQPGPISTAASNIELLRLQRHLEGEITRQDALADAAQEVCMRDVHKLTEDMRKLHDSLLNATHDVFERHSLDLLLSQQKIHIRHKLAEDIDKFREAYTKAAKGFLKQVNQNVLASYQNVVNNNSWLTGARYLHRSVKLFRDTHLNPTMPFLEWTGIQANLDKLEIDVNINLPASPRLDDIPAPPPPQQPIKRSPGLEIPELDPIRSIQMHNNWFFPIEEMGVSGASAFGVLDLNLNGHGRHDSSKPGTPPAFYTFLILLLLCDLLLLGHRMCQAWTTAKLCLYGFPEYYRENKEAEIGADDVFASRESKLTPAQGCKESTLYQSVALFFTQTISTTFFPKIVGAIATFVVTACLLQLGNDFLTVQELKDAGLYHSADEYLDLQTSMTNARLSAHAAQINQLQFPAFQASVSGQVTRHQTVLQAYRTQLLGLQGLSMEMYCQHLKAIDLQANCTAAGAVAQEPDKDAWKKMFSLFHACKFYPVVPRLYERSEEKGTPLLEAQIEAVLESLRNIIYLTSHLITIFVATVVLKELLCSVVWIFLQRSGAMRIRVIVERDQDESLQ